MPPKGLYQNSEVAGCLHGAHGSPGAGRLRARLGVNPEHTTRHAINLETSRAHSDALTPTLPVAGHRKQNSSGLAATVVALRIGIPVPNGRPGAY